MRDASQTELPDDTVCDRNGHKFSADNEWPGAEVEGAFPPDGGQRILPERPRPYQDER